MAGSSNGFVPSHSKHAIHQFAMQANFGMPAPDWMEWRSAARWKSLRSELVGKLPAFNIEDSSNGLITIHFGNVAPDGMLRTLFRVTPQTLTYQTSSYTTWSEIKSEALDFFKLATVDTFLSEMSSVAEAGLKYQNRFRWKGEASLFNPEYLVRGDSPWINSRSHLNRGFWHCHCGEFQKVDSAIRRLVHVNTSSLSEDTVAGPERLVAIDLTLTDAINAPDYEPTEALIGEAGVRWLTERFEDLHTSEKIIVSEVIVPEMQDAINLKAKLDV